MGGKRRRKRQSLHFYSSSECEKNRLIIF